MEAAAHLEAVVAQQAATIEKLSAEREQFRRLYMDLLERCEQLERGIVAGKKAERFKGNDAQLTLQMLEMLLDPEAGQSEPEPAAEPQKVREHERRGHGRAPLAEHLPRVEIVLLPPEVQQQGLDAFLRVGEEVREVLERRPASMVVVRIVRPKFIERAAAEMVPIVCTAPDGEEERACDEPPPPDTRFLIAELPDLPIGRGLAGPGMLADTIVRRWQDHMPLHRLSLMYARDGVVLARSTMCGWHEQLADQVEPLVDAMLRDAFKAPYLCADATGVLVLAEEQCRKAHFWVLVAPERHVLYRYTHRHDSAAVDRVLAGRHAHRAGPRLRPQPARRPAAIPRRRPPAAREQHLRTQPPSRGPRSQKLVVSRQRRGRTRQHDLRLPPRQLPAPRHRTLGLPPRPLLPRPGLARLAHPRARALLLEADSPAARDTAAPRRPRLPLRHARGPSLRRIAAG